MPIMHELFWSGGALVGGLFASRLGLPVFVGYLVAGLGFGLLGERPSELLIAAGEIGVLLLLFGVGLHLRPRNLLSRAVILGGGIHMLASVLLFVGVAGMLGLDPRSALLWGTLLSFSSTVLAAKTLDAGGELGAYYGRVAIGILILQDVVAVAVMVLVAGAAPAVWSLALLPGALLLRAPLHWLLSATESDELLLLTAALVALTSAAVFAQARLGAELGAIAAGALVASHSRADTLMDKLWGSKELLLVGFFLSVGMRVQPTLGDWSLAAAFVLLLPGKGWLFFALLAAVGLRARTAFLAGVTLTSYSEFTLIAGSIAHAHGLLPLAALGALTLTTIISFAVHPTINRLSQALYDRFQSSLERFERDVARPDEPAATIGDAQYLVLGMGQTGTAAYDFLGGRDARVVGFDVDPAALSQHRAADRRVTYGDAQDRELWRGLDLASVRGAVVTVPQGEGRLRATRMLRIYAPHAVISTFALHAHEAQRLRAAGADHVSNLLTEAGERVAELSLNGALAANESVPRG